MIVHGLQTTFSDARYMIQGLRDIQYRYSRLYILDGRFLGLFLAVAPTTEVGGMSSPSGSGLWN